MNANSECFCHVYLDLSRLGLPGKSPCLENIARLPMNFLSRDVG